MIRTFRAGFAANAYRDTYAVGGETTGGIFRLEWLPAAELLIVQSSWPFYGGFPLDPGDHLGMSPLHGHRLVRWGVEERDSPVFSDITKSWDLLAFTAAALGGSYVTGKSAEWIVQARKVGGKVCGHCPIYAADPAVGTIAHPRCQNMPLPWLSGNGDDRGQHYDVG